MVYLKAAPRARVRIYAWLDFAGWSWLVNYVREAREIFRAQLEMSFQVVVQSACDFNETAHSQSFQFVVG